MLINRWWGRGGGGAGGCRTRRGAGVCGSTDVSWLPICWVVSFTTALDCVAVWSLVFLHLDSQPRNPHPRQEEKKKKEMWGSSANVNWGVGVWNRGSGRYVGSPHPLLAKTAPGGGRRGRLFWQGFMKKRGPLFWVRMTCRHILPHLHSGAERNRFPQLAGEFKLASAWPASLDFRRSNYSQSDHRTHKDMGTTTLCPCVQKYSEH